MQLIDPAITDFYTQSAEESRLKTGLGPLEFERNKELISRYLPEGNGLIADIGGGPGHYAQWLAGLGHDVILVDPVPLHIRQAQKRASKSKRNFKCILGAAGEVPIENQTADLVILHGPLYHLQDQEERIKALKEARRILKTGGIVLGFAITYAASTLAALQNGMIHHQGVFSMCREELLSGDHFPAEGFPGMLAQAYFHRPSGLKQEFEAAGFRPLDLLAVEGLAWMDSRYFESWATPEKKEQLMTLLRLTEADEGLLCVSPHMMMAAEIMH